MCQKPEKLQYLPTRVDFKILLDRITKIEKL